MKNNNNKIFQIKFSLTSIKKTNIFNEEKLLIKMENEMKKSTISFAIKEFKILQKIRRKNPLFKEF